MPNNSTTSRTRWADSLQGVALLLALAVAVMGSSVSGQSYNYAYCWTNQQVRLDFQQIMTFYFPSCASGAYGGNYSIQGFGGNFDVEYGDQLCGTDWRSDQYFTSASVHYDSGFPYQNAWAYAAGDYASFFPKVNLWCRWAFGCKIEVTVCMNMAVAAGGADAAAAAAALGRDDGGLPSPLTALSRRLVSA